MDIIDEEEITRQAKRVDHPEQLTEDDDRQQEDQSGLVTNSQAFGLHVCGSLQHVRSALDHVRHMFALIMMISRLPLARPYGIRELTGLFQLNGSDVMFVYAVSANG